MQWLRWIAGNRIAAVVRLNWLKLLPTKTLATSIQNMREHHSFLSCAMFQTNSDISLHVFSGWYWWTSFCLLVVIKCRCSAWIFAVWKRSWSVLAYTLQSGHLSCMRCFNWFYMWIIEFYWLLILSIFLLTTGSLSCVIQLYSCLT